MDQLDQHPGLINLGNGSFDLDRRVLLPHDAADALTKLAATDYDPAATAPLWLETLAIAIPNEAERRWFQKYLGYCLSGHGHEKVLLLVHGIADSGKTTILNAPRLLLGDYGAVVAEKTVSVRKGDEGVPSDVARLRGIRYAVVSETGEVPRLQHWQVEIVDGTHTPKLPASCGRTNLNSLRS